ncbi:MAG: hypothetical protein WC532_07545 [Candidatus Omnitrophota bacterium]
MNKLETLQLSFYGVDVRIKSSCAQALEYIGRDFSYFKTPNPQSTGIEITVYQQEPPYADLAPMVASYLSPRNICYRRGDLKYIDYPGRALVIYDRKNRRYSVYALDPVALHEICYTLIISLIGEQFDKKGLCRVHALGFELEGKAILLLLGMGGGKTTITLDTLSLNNKVKLISEDSPLIDRQGNVFPFPLRIGIRPQSLPKEIPQHYIRFFPREEFGPKFLIDIEFFGDRISACRPFSGATVILGRRVLGQEPKITPVGKPAACRKFFEDCVIGMGLFQGIEYIFQKSPAEIISRIPYLYSRSRNAWRLINRAKAFEFMITNNREKNTAIFNDFLRSIS